MQTWENEDLPKDPSSSNSFGIKMLQFEQETDNKL